MTDAPLSADLALIQRIIPHRYPFLLVDKVRDIHLNKSCIGIKNVTFNERILVGRSMDLVDKNANVFFMGVDAVKFRRKVVPGDVMELHVTALRGGGRVWKFAGRAMVEGELACEAEFMAMFDVPKA